MFLTIGNCGWRSYFGDLYSHVMEHFWSATPIALDFKTLFLKQGRM